MAFLQSIPSILQVAVSEGLIWALMTIGIFITFRILEIADLSVEGTLVLGAAVAAQMLYSGYNPVLATFLALLIGLAGGLVTGLMHTKLKIPSIMAGILTMVGSWSIVIRIMGANVTLLRITTIFTYMENLGLSARNAQILMSGISLLAIGALVYCFFGTEIGSALRATGNNKSMVRAQGISTDFMIILGLMLANGLTALSGAFLTQSWGFASVDMGGGSIAFALAALIIAEVIFRTRMFWIRLISLAVGAILYRIIIGFVLAIPWVDPSDLRLFQAATAALFLAIPTIWSQSQKVFSNSVRRPGGSGKGANHA